MYGGIAADYYVFVAVFAGYAFSARGAVAAHVAFASAASSLSVLYGSGNGTEAVARALINVLLLVVVAGIVTLLRDELHARQRELEELAIRDPLTGVGNYRLLSERLEYEIARHRRSGGSLTVMPVKAPVNLVDVGGTVRTYPQNYKGTWEYNISFELGNAGPLEHRAETGADKDLSPVMIRSRDVTKSPMPEFRSGVEETVGRKAVVIAATSPATSR